MSPKKLPFPSFLGLVLKENEIMSSDPLLTKPNPRSGLDNGVVNKMHYFQDIENEWFYSDGDMWYYDDIVDPAQTERAMVEEIRANRNHDDGVLNDAEMGEAKDDSDSDYVPNSEEGHMYGDAQGTDFSQVLAGISDLKNFMTQRFNDQDERFGEINHRFDTQEAQFNEMKEQFHRWNTNLTGPTSDFFPEENNAAGNLDPDNEN